MTSKPASHVYSQLPQMAQRYEDGLHPVIYNMPEATRDSRIYTTLPQAYNPDRSPHSAPEAYAPIEKSFANAPQPIEHASPPSYTGDHGDAYRKESPHKDLITHPSRQDRGLQKSNKKRLLIISSFVLLVVLVLIIGLGVGLTRRNRGQNATPPSASQTAAEETRTSSTASVSQSPTSTTSQPAATSGFTGLAEVKCPSINNTVISSGTSRFRTLCAVHWITGQPAANNNGTVQSIGSNRLTAYSLEECLGHCVAYNTQLNRTVDPDENGSGCLAVTYNANLSASFSKYQQNCFLKDRQGIYDPAAETTESAILVGA